MIFDELPFELKEYIFTYVPANDWINTAKVSNEWLELTLGSIKKVQTCHQLILDHLAEFINQRRNTNYTWVTLLAMMPRLEHLESCENTEAFWTEISPICHQLKVLDCKPREVKSFDWNKLDINFKNLVELRWDDIHNGPAILLRILELAPKLDKITLKRFKINAEWKNKIPKSVKHIFLDDVQFVDEQQCSIHNLCEDTSTLETFSAFYKPYHAIISLSEHSVSQFFDAPRLKKLELNLPKASDILKNAFTRCPNLENVFIECKAIRVTDCWRKCIPASVESLKAYGLSVENNVSRAFSFSWLFQNYGALQSLEVDCVDWTRFDSQKFHSPKNLKKLYLANYMPYLEDDEPIDPFSDICYRMIGASHLVDIELRGPLIDESWRHIFPPTIKRLKLERFRLSKEAKEVFTPQFICENPSKIEFLSLTYFDGDLPLMDLNAFSGMSKLEELYLIYLWVSGECIQSILTHCSSLTNLFIRGLIAGALTNIPRNLVLPSLRKLSVKEPVDQPSMLLQHFPKMGKVDITIVPTKECWFEAMNCLSTVETAEINVMRPSFDLLWSLTENFDDAKFKYFRLSVVRSKEFTFHLTNSLLDACPNLNHLNFEVCFFFWEKNFPTSPLLRKSLLGIPSSMDELRKVYRNYLELL